MNAKFERAMCMAFSASPEASALLAEAVKENGLVLEALPDKMKTPELCRTAMHSSPAAFRFVPEKLKTPEFCREAIEEWPFALALVPEKLRTAELCILSLEKGGEGDPETWVDNGRNDDEYLYMLAYEGWDSPQEAVDFWPLVPDRAWSAVKMAAEEFKARNDTMEDEEDVPQP